MVILPEIDQQSLQQVSKTSELSVGDSKGRKTCQERFEGLKICSEVRRVLHHSRGL